MTPRSTSTHARAPLALGLLLALALPAAAQGRELSGRYRLRGLDGWRPVTVELVLERTSDRTYAAERTATRAGVVTSYRGEAWQEGDALSLRFDVSRGAAGALSGLRAGTATARYRLLGGAIAGSFERDGRTSRELGRRTGGAGGARPVAVLPVLARPPAQLWGRLSVSGRRIVDPLGREVVLRGVNAGSKQAPFLPLHDDAAAAALARATGGNLVRLYVAWRALEPAPGRYDAAYLDAVVAAVRRFRAAGLYVLVDLHQDVWGGPVTGHGAPDWATLAAGEKPLKLPAGASWQLRYADRRVYRSFEALWSNQPVPATGRGLADHYAAAWAALAARLRGEEGVVGYDPINEPFVGRELHAGLIAVFARSVPTLLGSGARALWERLLHGGKLQDRFVEDLLLHVREADRYERLTAALRGVNARFEARLAAFYERVGRAIRAADPGRPLFLEPMALTGVGVPAGLPRPALDQVVYAPHLYDAFVDSGLPYDGDPERVRRTLEGHRQTAFRLNAPLVIGEWGHLTPKAGRAADYARDVGALLDGALVGAAYWEHTPGKEQDPLFLATVRPYPRRVAGTLRALRWDPSTRTSRVTFQADPTIPAPTVIATPPHLFPHGVTVTLRGGRSAAEHDPTSNAVLVWSQDSAEVEVTLHPR
ncbi:MAG: cellulase family glycosylhydrolase [Planctomycetota bacterium]